VQAKDAMESVEVVPGTSDGGRRRVVLAIVVPRKDGVELAVGEVVTADEGSGSMPQWEWTGHSEVLR